MNKDTARDYLPLVQALADGKVIQHSPTGENPWWDDAEDLDFTDSPCNYRIKPESREIFVIRYKGGSESGPFSDKEAAECFALHDHPYSIVRYREVIE